MSFDYEIKADGSKAEQTIEKQEAGLKSVEAQAKRTGQAIGDAAKGSSDDVKHMIDQWEREEKVLERIRGPAREYQDDMQALNSLYRGGTINLKEYTDELERLNSAEERRHGRGGGRPEAEGGGLKIEGNLGKAFAGQAGEFGSMASSIASAGAIEATAIAAVAVEVIKLGDEYVGLKNHAMRLATSYDTVDKTIEEQLALSKDLHGSLDQTMELSIAMKERTDALGLSMSEQAQYTKEWGQMVQVSGHSLGEAAPALDKFLFALQLGSNGGKQLRAVFKEFPPLMEALEEHFGLKGPHALEELIDKAKKGQISMTDAFKAMDESSDKTADKLGHMQETLGTQWGHFKDDMTVAIGKFVEGTGVVNSLGEAFKGLAVVIEASIAPLQKLEDLMGDSKLKGVFTGGLLSNLGKLKDMFGEKEGLKTQADLLKEFQQSAQEVRLGAVADDVGELNAVLGRFNQIIGYGVDKTHDWLEAHKLKKGSISEEDKLLNAINGPMLKLMENERELAVLYSEGRVSLGTYLIEMEKFREELAKLNADQTKLAFKSLAKDLDVSAIRNMVHDLEGVGKAMLGGVEVEDARKKVLAMAEGAKATEKFAEELKKLDQAEQTHLITSDEHTQAVKKLRDRYDDIKTPADEFAKGLEVIHEKLTAGIYDATKAEQATAKLRAQYDKSFDQGVVNGLKKIHDEMMDVSSVAEKTMVDAFHSVEDAIVDLTTKGTTDWSKMIDSMIADLARLAVRQLEMSLLTSLGFGGVSLPGHAAGAEWTVGGSNGTDSSLQAFWASPGETVTVTPAGGTRPRATDGDGGGGGGRPTVNIHNHIDRRDLLSAIRTNDGDVEVVNSARRNAGALRSITQR